MVRVAQRMAEQLNSDVVLETETEKADDFGPRELARSAWRRAILNPTLLLDMIVAGAMAHGKVDVEYADECIAISEYPLSAAAALGRLCNSFENHLGIL